MLTFLEAATIALYATPGYTPEQSIAEARELAAAYCDTEGHVQVPTALTMPCPRCGNHPKAAAASRIAQAETEPPPPSP